MQTCSLGLRAAGQTNAGRKLDISQGMPEGEKAMQTPSLGM